MFVIQCYVVEYGVVQCVFYYIGILIVVFYFQYLLGEYYQVDGSIIFGVNCVIWQIVIVSECFVVVL